MVVFFCLSVMTGPSTVQAEEEQPAEARIAQEGATEKTVAVDNGEEIETEAADEEVADEKLTDTNPVTAGATQETVPVEEPTETGDLSQQIERHYQRGKQCYEKGEYQQALAEFNKAKELGFLLNAEKMFKPTGEKTIDLPTKSVITKKFQDIPEIDETIRSLEREYSRLKKKIKRLEGELDSRKEKIKDISRSLSEISGEGRKEKTKKKLTGTLNGLEEEYTTEFYKKKGYLDRQQDILSQLEELKRLKAIAYCNRGTEYAMQGYSNKAIEEYKRAIYIYPGDGQSHFNLATEYARQSVYEKAAQEYELVVQLEPGNSAALYNLAILYDDYLNDCRKAVLYYKRYLASAGDLPVDRIELINRWIKEIAIE